ncbi:MAG TPA: hypothetical protein VMI31_17900 [Fimbriimonadaceae bacterium]|nr:hypothetical protein [Fimbriimonadaceae bacterium]
MRLRRWWPVWLGVLATVAFGLWVAWRARQPEFAFLAGQRPFQAETEVPSNIGWAGKPFLQTVYDFKADRKAIIRLADAQLLRAGWKKDYWQDWADHDNECVVYRESGADGRAVSIEGDVSVPFYDLTTDISTGGVPAKGWVGVVVTRPEKKLGWRDRAISWLGKVFLGRP